MGAEVKRLDAVIIRYPQGGYVLRLPDSEYEGDTVQDCIQFAAGEGATRVYSTPGRYVLLGREDCA
jgi:hypothetical protein